MTFSKYYQKIWQALSFIYILITALSFIAFTAIGPAPQSYDYYIGIIVCLIFGYTFIRERFIYASIAGLIIVISYIITSVFITGIPKHLLIVSNFYLIAVNLLGMIVARYLEYSSRKDFYLEDMLSKEQENVLFLNSSLEQKVSERTSDLENINKKLKHEIKERERVERSLSHARKMESIGTLAGGIAHDFNNILSSVIGYTELALDDVEANSALNKYLHEIYIAGIRAKELVKQILSFARQVDETLKPIRVDIIIKEIVKLLRSSVSTSVEIESNINSESCVLGSQISIHQIILNLCINATQAMPDGGVLKIDFDDTVIDASHPLGKQVLKKGKYIILSVSDTGMGIPREIISSIFEPYFTTKQIEDGTGMGLAMVHGIVKKYQGEITVESEIGKGSRFNVFLPVTDDEKIPSSYKKEVLPEGTEKILLIDDETEIILMTKKVLEKLGYSVTTCDNSIEALELFKRAPDDFDLIITDITMPNMSGDRLTEECIKIRPDIPVILNTGYNRNISDEKVLSLGAKALTFKPLLKADFAKTIRRVLDQYCDLSENS